MTNDKLEILSVELLNKHSSVVEEFRALARRLRLEFGWHYLLDLSWIISNLDMDNAATVIDAGAGVGVMQWYLASKGLDVISVDRGSRENLDLRFRAKFKVEGLRAKDLASQQQAARQAVQAAQGMAGKTKTYLRNLQAYSQMSRPPIGNGRVAIYNQDLKTLVDIQDGSVDAVVAVSALEHNSPEGLREVVVELLRVLRPGGKLLATLGASPDKDWFHEPSQGWNYTEASLRELFSLDRDMQSNYDQHDQLLASLKACDELKNNLASFYSQSGENGMPWGVWDPQYVPVGVCKVKH